jgi:4-hydroxy-tetrahydrodipicolinate synthase
VPSRTGVNILPETYKALSEHKRIVAVKEANGNISSVTETRRLCGDALDVYSGNDDQTAPILALGGKGVISVAANIIPNIMHEIATDHERSTDLQIEYDRLLKALFCEVNPIPVKAAMETVWNHAFPLRLPLTSISDHNRIYINNVLGEYDLI